MKPTAEKITIDVDLVHDLIEALNGCDFDHELMVDRLTAAAEAEGLACWTDSKGNWKWHTL